MLTSAPSADEIAAWWYQGGLMLRAVDLYLQLHHGETFGGHTYDEWQTIADGRGRVSADWLAQVCNAMS